MVRLGRASTISECQQFPTAAECRDDRIAGSIAGWLKRGQRGLDNLLMSLEVRGKVWNTFPAFAIEHHDYQPEYRTMRGWKRSTAGVTHFEDLPEAAKDYVRFIVDEIEAPATIISTGPRREETILR